MYIHTHIHSLNESNNNNINNNNNNNSCARNTKRWTPVAMAAPPDAVGPSGAAVTAPAEIWRRLSGKVCSSLEAVRGIYDLSTKTEGRAVHCGGDGPCARERSRRRSPPRHASPRPPREPAAALLRRTPRAPHGSTGQVGEVARVPLPERSDASFEAQYQFVYIYIYIKRER